MCWRKRCCGEQTGKIKGQRNEVASKMSSKMSSCRSIWCVTARDIVIYNCAKMFGRTFQSIITYAEKALMHYMYSRANGIGRTAQRMYHALYFLPTRLNGASYLIFLEQVLSELLHGIPIAIFNRINLSMMGRQSL